MHIMLRSAIDAAGGVAGRADLLGAVPRHILDYAVRAGHLIRPFPRVPADPSRLDQPGTRARAALIYAGDGAALSHLTALGVWRLPGGEPGGPVHVMVGWHRRPRAARGIVVHRREGFVCEPPDVVVRDGLPTVRVERCVVDSWPLLPSHARRAVVIGAVAERLTTPARLLDAVATNLSLTDRAEFLLLANLLERGCRSELELWGYRNVFSGPDLPVIEWNVAVRLDHRTVYLDAYCRAARVNFELDGATWHTSPADRERDARRDAALAAMGIMVVRFTHDQMVNHPEQVRAQIRAIVAARQYA